LSGFDSPSDGLPDVTEKLSVALESFSPAKEKLSVAREKLSNARESFSVTRGKPSRAKSAPTGYCSLPRAAGMMSRFNRALILRLTLPMKLRLLYHGHCFDGVASAAVFTRFYRARVNADAEVGYAPLLHTPGALFDEGMFDGDENAIVDFKYSPSGRLTWWFDHHQSAFLSPEDEAHFRADTSGKKFWDAESKSCTEFIARVADERFGFRDPSLDELVRWAHTIDGAFYESAAQPVELKEPALQLMQVIENVPEDDFVESLIRALTTRTLEEVATGEEVQRRFRPLLARHRETRGSKASTSSSPTTSAPRRPTRSPSRAAASAPKSRSARTPSARARAATTSPPSASATAAAATP
jgi:hypothetical protein